MECLELNQLFKELEYKMGGEYGRGKGGVGSKSQS